MGSGKTEEQQLSWKAKGKKEAVMWIQTKIFAGIERLVSCVVQDLQRID